MIDVSWFNREWSRISSIRPETTNFGIPPHACVLHFGESDAVRFGRVWCRPARLNFLSGTVTMEGPLSVLESDFCWYLALG